MVEYGDIAKFECIVSDCDHSCCDINLRMYVNDKQIVPPAVQKFNLSSILEDERAYEADSDCMNHANEHHVYFWFVVNKQSIENVEHIHCQYRLKSQTYKSERVTLNVTSPEYFNTENFTKNCSIEIMSSNHAPEQRKHFLALLLTSIVLMATSILV